MQLGGLVGKRNLCRRFGSIPAIRGVGQDSSTSAKTQHLDWGKYRTEGKHGGKVGVALVATLLREFTHFRVR